MRRLVALVFTIPLAIILIALSVANRAPVMATVDPFDPGNPALSFSIPLFALILAALMIGVVLGSFLTWLNQGKHRSRAKLEASRGDAIRREADALKHERTVALQTAALQTAALQTAASQEAGSLVPALRNV